MTGTPIVCQVTINNKNDRGTDSMGYRFTGNNNTDGLAERGVKHAGDGTISGFHKIECGLFGDDIGAGRFVGENKLFTE